MGLVLLALLALAVLAGVRGLLGLLRDPYFWGAAGVSVVLVFIVRTPVIWVPLLIIFAIGLAAKVKKPPTLGSITKTERWREMNGQWVKVEEDLSDN